MCENVIPHLSINGRIVNISSQSSHINEYGATIRARFRNPDITFPELEALLDDYLVSFINATLSLLSLSQSASTQESFANNQRIKSFVQNNPQVNDENANGENTNNENTNDENADGGNANNENANNENINNEKPIDENSFGPPDRAYNISKAGVNVLTHIYAREHPGLSIHACCPGWVRTDMGYQVGPEPPKSLEDGVRIPLRLAFDNLDGQPRGGFWANSSARVAGDGGLRVWAEDGTHVFA